MPAQPLNPILLASVEVSNILYQLLGSAPDALSSLTHILSVAELTQKYKVSKVEYLSTP